METYWPSMPMAQGAIALLGCSALVNVRRSAARVSNARALKD